MLPRALRTSALARSSPSSACNVFTRGTRTWACIFACSMTGIFTRRLPIACGRRLRQTVGTHRPICRDREPANWMRASAAGDAHVAGDGGLLRAPVDDEVVALRLACDGLVDRAGQ